jgi:exopolysaccharide biosynthesis WecB/TagA/CpsF family protein
MTLDHGRIVLGGSPVDLLEMSDSLDRIARHLAAPDDPPLAVASINLDHVHHFGAGADWTGTLEPDGPAPSAGQGGLAWLNLIDGAPLAAQARRVTGRAWPRLAGSDLIGPILALCESRGTRIGFLGGAASTHRLVLTELAARYPGLPISGLWSPERNELRDPVRSREIAREIREAGTELLIVGLGKPRQELWIAEYGLATGCRVLLAFGAVVDFLAGRVARAPHWMSANGLEWAWRLALEPSRLFSRYVLQGPQAYLAVRRRSEHVAAAEADRGPASVVVGARPPAQTTELRFADQDEPADVAVIVVARNGLSLGPLLEALRAECQDLRLRCIVATQEPDRARPELVLQRDLILVTMEPDRGHAALINAATAHSGNAGAVLVLDGTSMIERGTVRAMVDRMNRVGAGAVMPRLLTADGAPRLHLLKEPTVTRALLGTASEPHDGTVTNRFSLIDADPESYEHSRRVRWGYDTALLVRRDIVDAVGDRDERFVDPTEESDYFRRIHQIGAPIWYEPTARIRYEPDEPGCTPALAALRAVNRVRFTRHSRTLGYAIAFQIALAATAARSFTDPAQRRILRTLLAGAALRPSPPSSARSTAVPAADPEQPWSRYSEPAGTIIIPAHNEAATISRTLTVISPLAVLNQADVIVVCNGCTDDTATIARQFRGITVYEIDTASKTAALNVGDAAASAWPRLYLDADVAIQPATIRAIFDAFAREQVLAVRPACVYDTTGASAPVKSYYRARGRIPTNRAAIWGAGAYAVNVAGHERFGSFPPVTADDSYVDSLFDSTEKVVVHSCAPVRVFTPRTVSALIAVLARQHRGAMELSDMSSTAGSVRALIESVRGPFSATDVFCYGVLTVLGRMRARRARSRGTAEWERDLSSRVLPPDLAA